MTCLATMASFASFSARRTCPPRRRTALSASRCWSLCRAFALTICRRRRDVPQLFAVFHGAAWTGASAAAPPEAALSRPDELRLCGRRPPGRRPPSRNRTPLPAPAGGRSVPVPATQHRAQWYRLMMGASVTVPLTFLRCLGVFRTVDSIRRPPTDQLAELVTSYRRVLAPLDAFVEHTHTHWHANAELRAAAGLRGECYLCYCAAVTLPIEINTFTTKAEECVCE
jgi:hypothetical protein